MSVDDTTRERRAWLVACAMACAALVVAPVPGAPQAPSAPSVNVQTLGPQVGDVVPAFSLPDSTGTVRTLSDITGPRGAMLVFSRSADW